MTIDLAAVRAGRGLTEWPGPPVGLLWHDAMHTADAIAADLRAWLPHLADDATIVLHDACSPVMQVQQGAGRVIGDWDWTITPWNGRPTSRGTLTATRPA